MTKIVPIDYYENSIGKDFTFCFRTCCMTLVQKLGILRLPNHERVKTGRRSPFSLNCSHMPVQIIQMMAFTRIMAIWTPAITL